VHSVQGDVQPHGNRMRAMLTGSALAMVLSGCAGQGGVGGTTGASTPSSRVSSSAQLSPPSAITTSSSSATGSTKPIPCLVQDTTVRFDFTQFQHAVCVPPGVVVTVSLAAATGKGWSVQRAPNGAVVALGPLYVGTDGTATTTARALRPGSTEVTFQSGPVSPSGPILQATLTITVPAR
jgi:hypothetical protein